MARRITTDGRQVAALTHDGARRRNIPTAEHQSIHERLEELRPPRPVRYPRSTPLEPGTVRPRDPDLDPQLVWRGTRIRLTPEQRDQLVATGEVELGEAQLVWRGKDRQDWSDLVVNAPPLYIQEKIHPKALIDDLARRRKNGAAADGWPDLFADFNGLPDPEARTEFYQHDQHWSNRMILGDSLQVMASLAEREGLRGKVQCIYFDPPYGIKFNSNWQVSTRSRDVRDGKQTDLSREPEQVKAFRDTWQDGIHSYITYLRDRLQAARDLLHESGSIFVQIGDENVHRLRALMDEVFRPENYVSEILVKKKGSQVSGTLEPVNDYILFYAKNYDSLKFRKLWLVRENEEIFDDFPFAEFSTGERARVSDLAERDDRPYLIDFTLFPTVYPVAQLFAMNPLKSGGYRKNQSFNFEFQGRVFPIGDGQCWKHTVTSPDGNTPGMKRLAMAGRLFPLKKDVRFIRYSPNPSIKQMSNWWDGLGGAPDQIYVVQTNVEIVKRCILMTTDPGDLVAVAGASRDIATAIRGAAPVPAPPRRARRRRRGGWTPPAHPSGARRGS
jgi:adenine-specific DNA-methyltransferase